jgi:glycosyltransferase involved in cell wall biosynthesis
MRILYIGANPRMRVSGHSAPRLRALGLKQGLEQAGVEVASVMAGDELDYESAQQVYSKQLKRLMPRNITGVIRDAYEIVLDRRFYRIIGARVQDIKPDIILQKHSRYGQVGVRLGRRHNIPVFLDDITPIWEGERYSDRGLKVIARLIRRRVFSRACGLIAVSPDMEMQLQSEGLPYQKIHLVPNGVDCTLFNPDSTSMEVRQRHNLDDKVVVGYVGGFQQWHRLDLFIQTAFLLTKELPNIHFILVGEDPEDSIKRMVSERGLANRFTFSGHVVQSDVPLYINAMDISVLPSTLPYMSPMKIYEYMAMGKPVIAPGNNTTVEAVVMPNRHGLLFEAGNADSMKNAIITLAIDPVLRQRMGKDARRSVQNNYTWYQQACKLIQAFKSTLQFSSNRGSIYVRGAS